ncbi:MAG: hypothetical protein WCK47_00830 [bacterium]|nr:hypothetical protein [Candidatus Sumerlaeota bacterium]
MSQDEQTPADPDCPPVNNISQKDHGESGSEQSAHHRIDAGHAVAFGLRSVMVLILITIFVAGVIAILYMVKSWADIDLLPDEHLWDLLK